MRLRSLLLSLCFVIATPAWASCPSRTYSYTTGQTIDPSQVTTNEDSLFTYSCAVDTFAAGSVNSAALADNAVTSAKINDGTIVNADISSSAAITYGKLSFSNNIVAGDIAAGAVDAGDMATTGTIADDKVFVADSATAGTWRTITNCTDTGGNHVNYTQSSNSFSCGTSSSAATGGFVVRFTRDTSTGSGTQAVTGVGFTPTSIIFFCAQSASREMSWGVTSGTAAGRNESIFDEENAAPGQYNINNTSIRDEETAGNSYAGTLSSFDADGFTISWTRTGTPTGTLSCQSLSLR